MSSLEHLGHHKYPKIALDYYKQSSLSRIVLKIRIDPNHLDPHELGDEAISVPTLTAVLVPQLSVCDRTGEMLEYLIVPTSPFHI